METHTFLIPLTDHTQFQSGSYWWREIHLNILQPDMFPRPSEKKGQKIGFDKHALEKTMERMSTDITWEAVWQGTYLEQPMQFMEQEVCRPPIDAALLGKYLGNDIHIMVSRSDYESLRNCGR